MHQGKPVASYFSGQVSPESAAGVWESALMSRRQLGVILAGLALGAASLATARANPGESLGGGSLAGNLALLVTGWAR